MIRGVAHALAVLVLLFALASCAGEPPAQEPPAAELTAEQPPLEYVSLGDSLSVGVGASDPRERGYSPLYRDLLAKQTGREVELTELGVSGETSDSFVSGSDSQLARAENALSAKGGAIVTLCIGTNDLLSSASGSDTDREEVLDHYSENLDYILRALGSASDPAPRIIVLALYNTAPGSFTDVWTDRLNAKIRSVAGENGASVADGDEAFRGWEAEYTHYARERDIHPTDEGYEALAQAFAEAMNGA